MKECASRTAPYFLPVGAFFPLTEFFIPARVVWAVTEITSLTRKMAGEVGAVSLRPLYPMLSPETTEDKK